MECTFYQFKRKIQCEECTRGKQLDTEETVNRLLGHFPGQKDRQNSTNNAFRPWYDEYSSGLTLMFKYPPPSKENIVNERSCIRVHPDDGKDSLEESSPEYDLQKVKSPTIEHTELHTSHDSCDNNLSTYESSISSEVSKKRLCSLKGQTLLSQHETVNKVNELSNMYDSSRQDIGSSIKLSSSSKTQTKLDERRDFSFSSRNSKDYFDSPSMDNRKFNESCVTEIPVPQKSKHSPSSKSDDKNANESCCSKLFMQKNRKDFRDLNTEDSKICPSKNNSKEDNTDGKWCTSVAGSTKRNCNSSPLRHHSLKEIIEMKKKYNLSDFHRGKWLINEVNNQSIKMSGIWREVCKMLKCGQLPNCNAKYEKTSQEIWIYCDVVYSLEVRKKLKSNYKLKMMSPLTYWAHPHGSVLRV